MKTNIVKSVWKEDKTVNNAWLSSADAWFAELISKAGFDSLTIDAQHGHAKDYATILSILQGTSSSPTVPIVRVPWYEPGYIMSMLDAGAMGLICPMINTRKETELFVQACRYAPQGYRSFGPIRAGEVHENYFEKANENIITMVMIETAEALRNIEDIAQTETLDALFLGPWDLSIALQHKQVADFESDEMKAIFEKVLNATAKNGIKAGIYCKNVEDAKKSSEMGFRFVTIFQDSEAIKGACRKSLQSFLT